MVMLHCFPGCHTKACITHTHTHTHTLGTAGAGVSGISRVDLSNEVEGLFILQSSVAHEFGQMKAF